MPMSLLNASFEVAFKSMTNALNQRFPSHIFTSVGLSPPRCPSIIQATIEAERFPPQSQSSLSKSFHTSGFYWKSPVLC